MRKAILALALALSIPLTASAQSYPPIDKYTPPLKNHQDLAQVVSDITLAAALTIDTIHSWKSEDPTKAFEMQALRTGVIVGASELAKFILHRTRPDGSDSKSMWSEHTALAASTINFSGKGPRLVFTIPLTFGTAGGRILGGKHFLSDTLVGAGVGMLGGLIR